MYFFMVFSIRVIILFDSNVYFSYFYFYFKLCLGFCQSLEQTYGCRLCIGPCTTRGDVSLLSLLPALFSLWALMGSHLNIIVI